MRCFKRVVLWLVLVSAVGLAGCQRSSDTGSQTSEGATPPQAQETSQQSRALAARDALFQELSGRLMAAMGNGGPSAAISVCQQEAPRIAAEVSEKLGVRIGRTSFKLRNPNNTPPPWADAWVEQRVAEPQFKDLPEGYLGALLPIRLKAQCLACHGPRESLAPEVQDRLQTLYPDDAATGFADGDLRGWFWVEVPPHSAASN